MKIRQTIYPLLTIFICLNLFLLAFLIYPTLMEIKNGSHQILLDRGRMVVIDIQSKNFSSFQENYKGYQPNFEKVDQLFIDAKNPVKFIEFLEKISYESGVSSDIGLAYLQESENINDLPVTVFQVHARGDTNSTMRFISKLENSPYLLRISKFIMKKLGQGEDNSASLDTNFILKVVAREK
jgi:hypothetical protein